MTDHKTLENWLGPQSEIVKIAAERDALRAEVARLRAAAQRALDEAVADSMDGWFANLQAALREGGDNG